MKYKAHSLYIAVLCGSLLLSLSWASAQPRKSIFAKTRKSALTKRKLRLARKRNSSPAPTMLVPMPMATPTPTLAGSYTLVNQSTATATVEAAIEYAVKGMWFEGTARQELMQTNLPAPQRITISYSATDVSITTDQSGLIQTPADGKPIKWKKYDVWTQWVSGNLQRTFKSGRGRRVNTYSLSSDGNTLTMHVTGKTEGRLVPSFKHPFEYRLDYRRD